MCSINWSDKDEEEQEQEQEQEEKNPFRISSYLDHPQAMLCAFVWCSLY